MWSVFENLTFLFWNGFLYNAIWLIVFLRRYNFNNIDNDNPAANQQPLLGQWGQLGQVADLFKVQKLSIQICKQNIRTQGKKDGFFMECGALDGEHLSNSLLFEIQFGWLVYYMNSRSSLCYDDLY